MVKSSGRIYHYYDLDGRRFVLEKFISTLIALSPSSRITLIAKNNANDLVNVRIRCFNLLFMRSRNGCQQSHHGLKRNEMKTVPCYVTLVTGKDLGPHTHTSPRDGASGEVFSDYHLYIFCSLPDFLSLTLSVSLSGGRNVRIKMRAA